MRRALLLCACAALATPSRRRRSPARPSRARAGETGRWSSTRRRRRRTSKPQSRRERKVKDDKIEVTASSPRPCVRRTSASRSARETSRSARSRGRSARTSKILVGDSVKVELSPYDPQGRSVPPSGTSRPKYYGQHDRGARRVTMAAACAELRGVVDWPARSEQNRQVKISSLGRLPGTGMSPARSAPLDRARVFRSGPPGRLDRRPPPATGRRPPARGRARRAPVALDLGATRAATHRVARRSARRRRRRHVNPPPTLWSRLHKPEPHNRTCTATPVKPEGVASRSDDL